MALASVATDGRGSQLAVARNEGTVRLALDAMPILPTGNPMSVFDAAQRYKAEGTPLVVLAGKEYGTGSSRDWAAKGTLLLGVRAVTISQMLVLGYSPPKTRDGCPL